MKLSTRARYGMRVMVELARAHPGTKLSVKQVAQSQDLSRKYLERIMKSLKAAGLVLAFRGVHGGYSLAAPAASIRTSEVFRALEGSLAPVDCVDDPDRCKMAGTCPARQAWVQMTQAMTRTLEAITLQDLLDSQVSHGA